jgi:hypothetical protein
MFRFAEAANLITKSSRIGLAYLQIGNLLGFVSNTLETKDLGPNGVNV